MKNFNQLSRAEMKNVMGGVASTTYNCQCTGSVGTWTSTWSSAPTAQQIANDIADSCSSGQGTCTRADS